MNRLNAFNCHSEYYTIYDATLEEIVNDIDKYPFNTILYSPELEIEEGILEFTQENRPISIGYDYVFKNYLGINGNYYLKNKTYVNKSLYEIGRRIKTKYLYIDKKLVNNTLEKILIKNQNIDTLVIDEKLIKGTR